jgi:hypothetical protein
MTAAFPTVQENGLKNRAKRHKRKQHGAVWRVLVVDVYRCTESTTEH